MRRIITIAALALLMAGSFTATAGHEHDPYTELAVGPETLYIDDDPYPYIYLECNGWPGMQRDWDGNQHGHPGHDNPDCWIF